MLKRLFLGIELCIYCCCACYVHAAQTSVALTPVGGQTCVMLNQGRSPEVTL